MINLGTRNASVWVQFAALLNEKKAKTLEWKEKAEEWEKRALAAEERLSRGDFQVSGSCVTCAGALVEVPAHRCTKHRRVQTNLTFVVMVGPPQSLDV